MKDLFEAATAREVRERIERLGAESERQWGAMTAAQMLAHCSAWMEMAAGLNNPPRALLGRIVGGMAKRQVMSEKPIGRNMPTEKSLRMQGEMNFAAEQQRLLDWVDRFQAGGAEKCTRHPHCFFGPMTPEEWARMGYKHLDHHLKQFGV